MRLNEMGRYNIVNEIVQGSSRVGWYNTACGNNSRYYFMGYCRKGEI